MLLYLCIVVIIIGTCASLGAVTSSLSNLSEDLKTIFDKINVCLDDELAQISPESMTEKIAESNSGLTLSIILLILSMFLFGIMVTLPYLMSEDLRNIMLAAEEKKAANDKYNQ